MSRKNPFPSGGLTVTVLFVPSSVGVVPTVVQFVVATFAFCCKVKPIEGDGQESRSLLEPVNWIFNDGSTARPTNVTTLIAGRVLVNVEFATATSFCLANDELLEVTQGVTR